ncbi:MAG TPA: hypothetical protein VJC12_03220 [Candidatus Paceibacterota bacterium]
MPAIQNSDYVYVVAWFSTSLRPSGRDLPFGIVLWDKKSKVFFAFLANHKVVFKGIGPLGDYVFENITSVLVDQFKSAAVKDGEEPFPTLWENNRFNLHFGQRISVSSPDTPGLVVSTVYKSLVIASLSNEGFRSEDIKDFRLGSFELTKK